eukprot:TRINITY_DN1034_c0_g1_i1.p1 TRINITY_DN1034_c0_g1~~TRINITY_DN1034_c0_g1_i1.p1  ORF type:complete len:396 (-),score=98.95 TRINITY_DN1034_c0_g1_i1:250-1437(-)
MVVTESSCSSDENSTTCAGSSAANALRVLSAGDQDVDVVCASPTAEASDSATGSDAAVASGSESDSESGAESETRDVVSSTDEVEGNANTNSASGDGESLASHLEPLDLRFMDDDTSSSSSPCAQALPPTSEETFPEYDLDEEALVPVDAIVTPAVPVFDPYLFISQLPLSPPVSDDPTPRLPPKAPGAPLVTLVLDLDETLLHGAPVGDPTVPAPADYVITVREPASDCDSEEIEYTLSANKRPHLEEFLKAVAPLFEVVVFTASQPVYAGQLIDRIDPTRSLIAHRLYRDACCFSCGNFMKDLSVLGRDLSHIVLVDNSPHTYGYQIDNGIPIASWYGDACDSALVELLPFLKQLATCEDVRPLVREQFQTCKLVEAARAANDALQQQLQDQQ